jgi:p-hydroxybenzoate 3-monooxygenase
VLRRIRAGVLEHEFRHADAREAQCGERMDRKVKFTMALSLPITVNSAVLICTNTVTVARLLLYGQTELTRDLYEARDRMNGIVIHNVEDVQLHDLLSANPHVTYRTGDEVAY